MARYCIQSLTTRDVRFKGNHEVWLFMRRSKRNSSRFRYQLMVHIECDYGLWFAQVMDRLLPIEWHPNRTKPLPNRLLRKVNPKNSWLHKSPRSHVIAELNRLGHVRIEGVRLSEKFRPREYFKIEVTLPIYFDKVVVLASDARDVMEIT